jgi:hypothetical protein
MRILSKCFLEQEKVARSCGSVWRVVSNCLMNGEAVEDDECEEEEEKDDEESENFLNAKSPAVLTIVPLFQVFLE